MRLTTLRWNDADGEFHGISIFGGSAHVGTLVDLLLGHMATNIRIEHSEHLGAAQHAADHYRAALERIADLPRPSKTGQHWRQIAREALGR